MYVFYKTCSIVRRYLYERIFIADVLTGAMIVVLGIGGVMDLLGGFLGLRAAKDPSKSAAALVFGTLAPGKSAEIKAFRTSFPEVRNAFSLQKM